MRPKSADLVTPALFQLVWKNGETSQLGARALRLACPCAQCVEEWTGRRVLDPASVPESITILAVDVVGRYAFCFRFADGHETGIFSFEYLWQLAHPAGDAAQ